MIETFKDGIIVWLRDVGDVDDPCWVPCNKIDPGAFMFISVDMASTAVALSPLTEAFEQFKLAFISAGGTRNPLTPAKGWRKTEQVFRRVVTKDKHDPQAVVTGTQAFAAYMRKLVAADPLKVEYIPGPIPFLNGEQFMQDWNRACAKPAAPTMFDVAQSLTDR